MLWQYKLTKLNLKLAAVFSQIEVQVNDFGSKMQNHAKVKSRIQAPRPRPRGYWNPF